MAVAVLYIVYVSHDNNWDMKRVFTSLTTEERWTN